MRSILKILSIIAFIGIFIGCSNKQRSIAEESSIGEGKANTVEIKFDEATSIAKGLEVFTTIKFEEDTEHIMGSIQQMVVKGDTIFGIDPISHPGLYAYLKNGSQLFAYCSRGQGPEDLISPMNISINDNRVSVFDFAEKRIFDFTRQGEFIKTTDLPFFALSAMRDPISGIWVDYSNQEYEDVKLGWMNDETDSIMTVLKVPDHLKGMTEVSLANLVTLPNGELRYMPSLEPLIYNLCEGHADLLYRLEFNGIWPSEEEIKEKYSGNDWAIKYKDFPIRSNGFCENEQWLVLGFSFVKKLYIIVYDKLNLDSRIFIDNEDTYFGPKYIDGSNLYMHRKDDSIDIIKI